MKHKVTSVFLSSLILLVLSTGCASIVSKSKYPFSINSTPSEAKITVTDKNGVEIFTGKTPATLKLKSGNGYFSKAHYDVKFEKEGYDSKVVPIEFKLDGWYFGNILIGGAIGLLIVDPATGAMYKLKTEFLNETLTQSVANNEKKEKLGVYTLNAIPDKWKEHLIVIDE